MNDLEKSFSKIDNPKNKENKTRFSGGSFYKLTSDQEEVSIAYFYYNPDAEIWGFGFNISDGSGFLPAYDLTEKTEVTKVEFKEESKKLTGSEAVFGFCAWLTCRSETTIMSAKHSAGNIAELAGEFCKVNKLKDPRDNYTDFLTHPTDK